MYIFTDIKEREERELVEEEEPSYEILIKVIKIAFQFMLFSILYCIDLCQVA